MPFARNWSRLEVCGLNWSWHLKSRKGKGKGEETKLCVIGRGLMEKPPQNS